MSMKMAAQIRALQEEKKELEVRLDKMEKEVNTLKKSVSFMERNPTGKSGVRVPRTELPETLEKLEIGKPPQGT